MLISEAQLLARVSEVIRPFGCEVTAIGPNGCQQRDFGRVYGPSVIVRGLVGGASPDVVARMTQEVTSKVSGITGVSFTA